MNLYESRNNTKIYTTTHQQATLAEDGGGTQFLDFVRTIEEVLNQLSSVGETIVSLDEFHCRRT